MGYQAGESRTQAALFPVMLEDAVVEDYASGKPILSRSERR